MTNCGIVALLRCGSCADHASSQNFGTEILKVADSNRLCEQSRLITFSMRGARRTCPNLPHLSVAGASSIHGVGEVIFASISAEFSSNAGDG